MYYNCYEIKCMKKIMNIDCGVKQKITWFHILLARNNIFPPFTVTSYQPHLANKRWSCLEVQTQASGNSNVRLAMLWKTAVSQPGLMSHQHLQFLLLACRDRQLFCNYSYHFIFLTTLPLTRQPNCLPTHEVTLENQVACTK